MALTIAYNKRFSVCAKNFDIIENSKVFESTYLKEKCQNFNHSLLMWEVYLKTEKIILINLERLVRVFFH